MPKKGKKASNKKPSAVVICVIATAALLVVLAALWFFLLGPGRGLFALKNMTVAGIDLEGMNKEEAMEALMPLKEDLESNDMVITVLEEEARISPEDSGATLDVEGAVDAIFDTRGKEAFDLIPYLNLDKEAIWLVINDLADAVQSEYTETAYSVEAGSEEGQQILTVTMGTPACQLNSEDLFNNILTAYASGEFSAKGICQWEEPEAISLDALVSEYCTAPIDATMDEKTFAITDGTPGYGFDRKEAEALLKDIKYGETITLTLKDIEPAVTAKTLEDQLFADVLASCSTPHTGDEDRNTNLRLACEAIDGMILYPGDVFSYNDALGERTPEKGYRPGASYEGDKVVYTYGGGICQVSSTLYHCSLHADLEILERECHMYTPDYIEYGMDATINWGTIDYKFRNNTDYPIRIDASMADGYVNVALMGTDDKDYYVDMEYYIVGVFDYETKYEEYPEDNEKGYEDGQTIVWPITGYGVDTYRCKYDKETGELISDEFEAYSDYDHRDQVIVKIISESDTPPNTDDFYVGSGGGITPDGG